MSFASRMLIKLLQVSGMKGKLARGSQKTFEEAVSYNRKHPFVMPEDHKAIYEQINIRTGFGVYPCLKISQSDSCRDRAVLFTWGGGLLPCCRVYRSGNRNADSVRNFWRDGNERKQRKK